MKQKSFDLRTTIKWFVGLLLTSLLLSFLYQNSTINDQDSHQFTLQQLNQLKIDDNAVTTLILENRAGLLLNYDLLTGVYVKIRNNIDHLNDHLPADTLIHISEEMQDYLTLIEQKRAVTEEFKSHNATLKNSLYYLPKAVDDFSGKVLDQNRVVAEDLRYLLRFVLEYSVNSTTESHAQLMELFEKVRTHEVGFTGTTRKEFGLLISHIDRIVIFKEDVDLHVKELIQFETDSAISDIYSGYLTHYEHQVEKAELYSIFLFVVSALLILLVISFIIRLKRSSKSLGNLVNELNFQKYALDEHSIVSITDVKGDITYVNDKFCEISGYSRDELMGKNHRLVKSDEHPASFYADMWKTIANGKSFHGEVKNRCKDGSYYWVDATIVPFLNEQGKPFRYVSIRSDITARKAMAEEIRLSHDNLESLVEERTKELRESEQRLQFTQYSVDHAVDCVFWVRPEDASFDYVNDTACGMLGYSREEFNSMAVQDIDPEFPMDQWNAWVETLQTTRNATIESTLRRKDGYEFPMEGAFYLSEFNGKKIIVAFTRDITARKLAEKELHQAKEKAEEATIAKGDFLANMSHEIRTPMNAILGLSHLALATDLNRKQHDYISKVYNSAQNLLGIINDILDFSKVEAGKLDIEQVDFDLNDVLDSLSSVINVKANEKGLKLLIATPVEIPTALCGDPLRLGQILINLANNAVKFTDSGEITINIGLIDADSDRVNLRFEVRDTGIGLSAEQQARLFRSFSQADGSTTRKYGGTGLGLSICKRLVELMGGEIGVESESDKGSTFFFNIPFACAKSDVKRQGHTLPHDLQNARVLVVDDDAMLRGVFMKSLDLFGFKSDGAVSGDEAIQILQDTPDNNPYQLVLMDWKMSGMNGIEASKQIIQSTLIHNRPAIIMVSAYGAEEQMKQALDIGVDGYLVKPVSQSMLFDTVMHAFNRDFETASVLSRTGELAKEYKPLHGAHLLLVEDNEINQQVAQELLLKAGITVTIASDGQQALEAIDKELFDGVLMDLQMPVMDGFETTRTIRKDERFNDLPIIAMTANAMTGDRERCLEAGMNDHVAKPIELKQLYDALVLWVTASKPALMPAAEAGVQKVIAETLAIPELTGIDVESGLKRVAGNRNLYLSILRQFSGSAEHTVKELTTALSDGDIETASRSAHTLRGVAGNIGASELQDAAAILESELRQGKSSGLELELKSIDIKLAQILLALSVLNEEEPEGGSLQSSKEIDVEVITPLFIKLKALLEDDDGEASEVIYELEISLKGTVIQTELKQLAKVVDQFDYEQALKKLEVLVQSCDEAVGGSGDT